MWRQHNNHLIDNASVIATMVFLLNIITTGGNQTQPIPATDINDITETTSFLQDISYTTGNITSENLSSSTTTTTTTQTTTQTATATTTILLHDDIELTQNNIIASELVQTTISELSSTSDDTRTSNSNAVLFTTIRPFIAPTLADYRHRITHSRPYQSKHHHEHHWGPFFEEPLIASTGTIQVGAHLGTESLLNCRVGMLRDKTVMWVRKTTDKVSLLTVGNNTYSSDPRIGVKFQYPNNWRLHINPVQKDDAGLYMCQVSTHPPRVFATNVTVLGPAIRVVDEHGHEVHDRYYKTGSTIDLTCQVAVSFLSVLPTVIPGIHPYLMMAKPNNAKINIPSNYNTTTNITTTTKTTTTLLQNIDKKNVTKIDYYHQKLIWLKDGEPLPKDGYLNLSSTLEWRSSRLTIPHADRTHSGIYSCSIVNSSTAVVHVQILNDLFYNSGETPAAVQHNNSCNERKTFNTILMFNIIFIIILPLLDISISC